MSRRTLRPVALVVQSLRDELAPAGLLARIETVWERAVGETIAAEARPVSERDGVLTVACSSAVWAAELSMLSVELLQRCNAALGEEPAIAELRWRVGATGETGPRPRRD